jgi:AcrR family transcriptional regulator
MSTAAASTPRARVRRSREESRARIVAAAIELVRERSFLELSVSEVMEAAGAERTIFYRHFDDLADLLRSASREAMESLYAAELDLGSGREGIDAEAVREALEPAVSAYSRFGPLLRALTEAAAGDERIAEGQQAIRRRFDDLVAGVLDDGDSVGSEPSPQARETARALNLMNESYLQDAFGREPRVSPETALQTLSEMWIAVIEAHRSSKGN